MRVGFSAAQQTMLWSCHTGIAGMKQTNGRAKSILSESRILCATTAVSALGCIVRRGDVANEWPFCTAAQSSPAVIVISWRMKVSASETMNALYVAPKASMNDWAESVAWRMAFPQNRRECIGAPIGVLKTSSLISSRSWIRALSGDLESRSDARWGSG